jgi:hypothetical protein
MSFDLNLEIENVLSDDDVKCILSECGATDIEGTVDGMNGVFPLSGMTFVYKNTLASSDIAVEDVQESDWRVGSRIYFRFRLNEMEQSSGDLNCVLETFASKSSARFILSYQFERTYAVRDRNGLRLLEKF